MINGWVNIYKPEGIGSNKLLGEIKKSLYEKGLKRKDFKIGFLGTLDPFACGVLPVAFGSALKSIHFIKNEIKTYEFVLKFGSETDTLDLTGNITGSCDVFPTEDEVLSTLPLFVGKIEQTPPVFSALKIDGKRAYDLARENRENLQDIQNKIKKRIIDIFSLEMLEKISDKEYKFKVVCSKGTYVRTLGADMAKKLGSMGHLTFLERTGNGRLNKADAKNLDFLKEIIHNAKDFSDADYWGQVLKPVNYLLDGIPAVKISVENEADLIHGRFIEIQKSDEVKDGDIFQAILNNKIIAICKNENMEGQNFAKPVRVFKT